MNILASYAKQDQILLYLCVGSIDIYVTLNL